MSRAEIQAAVNEANREIARRQAKRAVRKGNGAKITRGFVAKATTSNSSARTITFRVSSTSVDSQDEIVISRALYDGAQWFLAHNPVVINSHKSDDVRNIVGRVVTMRLAPDKKSVEATVQFVDEEIFTLYRDGFANGVSIGFAGLEWVAPSDIGRLSADDQAALRGLDLRGVRKIWTKVRLYELSVVIIPACHDALAIRAAKAARTVPPLIRPQVAEIVADALDGRSALVEWWQRMRAEDPRRKETWGGSRADVSWLAEDRARVMAEAERQRRMYGY